MSLSTILRFELLDYVEEVHHVNGKLEAVFGSHDDGEDFLFPLTISIFLGESTGYIIVENGGIAEIEPFAYENVTQAAVFYAKLEMMEYTKRRLRAFSNPEANEFNCRDRKLFGWGEYLWPI